MSDLTKHHDPRVAAMYKRMASGKKSTPSASAPAGRKAKAAPTAARKPVKKAVTQAGLSSFGHLLNGDPARAAEVAAASAAAAQSAALTATIADAIAIARGHARPAATTAKMDPIIADAIALVNATSNPPAATAPTTQTASLDRVISDAVALVNSTRR